MKYFLRLYKISSDYNDTSFENYAKIKIHINTIKKHNNDYIQLVKKNNRANISGEKFVYVILRDFGILGLAGIGKYIITSNLKDDFYIEGIPVIDSAMTLSVFFLLVWIAQKYFMLRVGPSEDSKYELLKKDVEYLKQEVIRQDKEIQTLNKKVPTKKQLELLAYIKEYLETMRKDNEEVNGKKASEIFYDILNHIDKLYKMYSSLSNASYKSLKNISDEDAEELK